MNRSRLSRFLVLPFLLVALFTAHSAFAQSLSSGQGLTISPFLLERQFSKGQGSDEIIDITNTSDRVLPVTITVNDFLPVGDSGQAQFVAPGQGDPHYSLSSWINITSDPKPSLQPGEKTSLHFTISVPANAEDGGHYGAILFTFLGGSQQGTGSIVVQKIGAIILAKVGKAVEDGQIVRFSAEHGYYNYPPVNFITTFKNTGNVHVKPRGSIAIYNWFGKKIANVLVNENANNVLANTQRSFISTWKDTFAFGRYRAEVKLIYGDSGLVENSVTYFWVIPWKWTLGAALALFILIMLIISGLRRYNRWLIKKFTTGRNGR